MQRKKVAGPLAVTANYLDSGFVVFLADDGRWSADIADIKVTTDGDEAAALLAGAEADAARNLVLNPYLIEMVETAKGWRPVAQRELIRAFGPPVEARNLQNHVQA